MVLKESTRYSGLGGRPHRVAWFAALAGNSNKGGEFAVSEGGSDVENVKVVEEKRLQRRRSGGGGGGSGGAVPAASPDLLTIPGVGPRNLRKLVDKGFEGVAQLKQLYKDKVCSIA